MIHFSKHIFRRLENCNELIFRHGFNKMERRKKMCIQFNVRFQIRLSLYVVWSLPVKILLTLIPIIHVLYAMPYTPYYLVWKSQILYKHSLNTFSPKWVLFWCSSFSFCVQSYFARTSFSCELFINSIRALYMNYVFNVLFSHHPYWFDLICGGLDFEPTERVWCSGVLPLSF